MKLLTIGTGIFSTIDTGNTTWVLVSAALVLFMTPGLAFFYGGLVRAKHTLSMLLQNFFALGIISVVWAICGFSLAFGGKGGLIGDFSFFGFDKLSDLTSTIPGFVGPLALTIPPIVFAAYQMMFAVITPALITGATADRLKFSAYAIFIALWSVLVYSPVAHWIFSPNGWLFKLGALDFAGGAVVHINAGIAALVLVLMLGKRKGLGKEAMAPHSIPLTLLGTGILWFGWFGFNAGSALGAGGLAGSAFINTHLSAAAAMCTWMIVEKKKAGHFSGLGAGTGAVAGLVSITPCAGFVAPWAALVIGALTGVLCYLALSLKTRFGFDDALDVIGVHLVGGMLGSILLGLFATKTINAGGANGLFYGGGLTLVWKQTIAVLATGAYSGIMSTAIAYGIKRTIGLRVSPADEQAGLDISEQAEHAYSVGSRF